MSSNLTIREATETDIQLINELATQIWEPTYCHILPKEQIDYMFGVIYTEEALLKQMQEGQVFLLLFDENIRACGFASFSLKQAATAVYKLNKIYLLPHMQGKGAGRRLIEGVEKEVAARGARVLELNVNRYNVAKQFYEAFGYRVVREEDIPIGPYWMNDFIMAKELA